MKIMRSSQLVLPVAVALFSIPVFAAEGQAPGVPNFHRVNERVFRGGQPTDEGFQSLAKLGVKTVIDLRRPTEHATDLEAAAVKAAGMRYVNVPMQGIVAPDEKDILKILDMLGSKEPVFVHCKEGKDRTGTVIACYRMAHDGWDNRKALSEAKSYGMHWFEPGMKAYILSFRPAMQEAAVTPVVAAN